MKTRTHWHYWNRAIRGIKQLRRWNHGNRYVVITPRLFTVRNSNLKPLIHKGGKSND